MVKEVIGTGANVEEALANAREQLGIDEFADIDYEVVQREQKKVLGIFGGALAKVKVFLKSSPADVAEDFLKNVISAMKIENITIDTEKKEDSVSFNISGEDIGSVIGKRGETLNALQYITSLVANNVENSFFKVTVDVENYREKRQETLEILGRKIAFKALKTRRKVSLEPMNPNERRIIHTAVQKINGVTSWSEGEKANRHVVIGPDSKKGNYKNRKDNKKEEKVSVEREPLNEGNSTELYGRIG